MLGQCLAALGSISSTVQVTRPQFGHLISVGRPREKSAEYNTQKISKREDMTLEVSK